jgi:ABC-2 type transport system permease protein
MTRGTAHNGTTLTGTTLTGTTLTGTTLTGTTLTGTTLTGTWSLVRFILRRDRVRLPVWIVGITLLVLSTAASVRGLYPTQAELDAAAAPMLDNAAVIALNGPTYGIDTYGGQIVFQVGSFGYVVVALMGMFLVGRHTRADEESERTELIRATVVGRNAPVTAVLIVAAAAFILLGGLTTISVLSQDVPMKGSIVFGAAMGAFGLFFACVTAVTVQISEHNRAALGLAGALLGFAYVLRAIGDVGDGTLSWLSPMGWAQASRPFAGERPWTLLLLVGGSAALIGVAFYLQGIRDLGAGLVRPRPGPPHASPALTGPAGLAIRLQRASVVGWALGLVVTGIAYGSVAQDVKDLVGDNQSLEDLIAQSGGDLTASFFATSLLIMALITGGFAVASTLRLRGEETGDRAEPLLAAALSRGRWATSHLLVALVGSALICAGAGVGMGLTYGVAVSDLGEVWPLLGGALAFAPALWVLVGVTFALFGLAPRAVLAAWAALASCFVIGMFGPLFDLPQWVMDLSPFQHVPQIPAQDFSVAPVLVLTAVAAALLAAGFAGIRRRDIPS